METPVTDNLDGGLSDPVVLDGVCPLLSSPRFVKRHLAALRAGGINAAIATVSSIEAMPTVLENLAAWQAFSHRTDTGVRVTTSAQGIRQAKADGVLAIGLHAQGLDGIASNSDLLEVYHRMGVRTAQLTYNYRNSLGDGCLEPEDAGLSEAGRQVVQRANALGILLDISHTGARTSSDMLNASSGPVIASHSNSKKLCNSPRNLSDDHIRAVAESGGIIGLCAFSAFVASDSASASAERLADHAAHIAELVGADHVSLGLDFATEDEDEYEYYRYDPRYYPRPPWTWPSGIEDWTKVPNLRSVLAARGFSERELTGILGENALRVYRQVWRD